MGGWPNSRRAPRSQVCNRFMTDVWVRFPRVTVLKSRIDDRRLGGLLSCIRDKKSLILCQYGAVFHAILYEKEPNFIPISLTDRAQLTLHYKSDEALFPTMLNADVLRTITRIAVFSKDNLNHVMAEREDSTVIFGSKLKWLCRKTTVGSSFSIHMTTTENVEQ